MTTCLPVDNLELSSIYFEDILASAGYQELPNWTLHNSLCNYVLHNITSQERLGINNTILLKASNGKCLPVVIF